MIFFISNWNKAAPAPPPLLALKAKYGRFFLNEPSLTDIKIWTCDWRGDV